MGHTRTVGKKVVILKAAERIGTKAVNSLILFHWVIFPQSDDDNFSGISVPH